MEDRRRQLEREKAKKDKEREEAEKKAEEEKQEMLKNLFAEEEAEALNWKRHQMQQHAMIMKLHI